MKSTPPVLTDEERSAALTKALIARKARSELFAALKSGTLTIADVLAKADTDDTIRMTRVGQLLKALPGIGMIGARELLDSLNIAETRRVRGLSTSKRQALLRISDSEGVRAQARRISDAAVD